MRGCSWKPVVVAVASALGAHAPYVPIDTIIHTCMYIVRMHLCKSQLVTLRFSVFITAQIFKWCQSTKAHSNWQRGHDDHWQRYTLFYL